MIKQLKELSALALVKTGQYGPFKLEKDNYDEIEYAQLYYNNKKDDRFNIAAKKGRLDLLIRLVKDGHTWNIWTCEIAAKYGRLEILKWLRDPNEHTHSPSKDSDGNGSKGNVPISGGEPSAMCEAQAPPMYGLTWIFVIKNGHPETLHWLCDPNVRKDAHICEWNEWVCIEAVKYGRLEILKWLCDPNARSDGSVCRLNIEECMKCAKENNHTEIIEWLDKY